MQSLLIAYRIRVIKKSGGWENCLEDSWKINNCLENSRDGNSSIKNSGGNCLEANWSIEDSVKRNNCIPNRWDSRWIWNRKRWRHRHF